MSPFRPRILVAALGVFLAAPGAAAQARRSAAADSLSTVAGTITDHETGQAVSGATISLVVGTGEARAITSMETDRDGSFRFSGVRPGTYHLTVDGLGYRRLADSLAVPPGAAVHVQAELSTQPLNLEPVVVVVSGRDKADAGLEGRERRGVGTILTRDRIEATKAAHVSDVLRIVPGLRLVPEGDLGYTVRLRGGCRPAIWIDDARTQSIDVDAILLPSDLETVEVYQASQMPARFGQDPCGAVVFWTRRTQPGTGKASAWKRIVLSGVVLTAMFWRFF